MAALALAVTVPAAPPDSLPNKAEGKSLGRARRNVAGIPIHLKRLKRRIEPSENLKGGRWIIDLETGIEYARFSTKSHNVGRSTMQNTCRNVGGFLPEPRSQLEGTAVVIIKRDYNSVQPMLGIRQDSAGVWKYDRDGSRLDWTPDWEGSIYKQHRENCAMVVLGGTWDDVSCAKRLNQFICERATAEKPVAEWKLLPSFDSIHYGKRYIDLKKPGEPTEGNQQACSDIDAYLPQPMDGKENDFLKKMTPKDFRLGMSYIKGVWRFTHGGDRVTWFDWINNNRVAGDHRCVSMGQISGVRGWIDQVCESQNGLQTVVCEHELSGDLDGQVEPNIYPKGWEYDIHPKQLKNEGQGECPNEFYQHGQICYRFTEKWLTWKESKDACTTLGAYLAEPKNLQESTFIKGLVAIEPGYWIGGTDSDTEGQWYWTTSGDRISEFVDWRRGQPDGGSRQNCLQLNNLIKWGYSDVKYQWNDVECHKKRRAICQKPLEGTTKNPDLFIALYCLGENTLKRLQCSGSSIQVVQALYGNAGLWGCPRPIGNCYHNRTCIIAKRCDGKKKCEFVARVGVFCGNLQITYRCIQSPRDWKYGSYGKRYIDLKIRGDRVGGNQQACQHLGAFLPEPQNEMENDFLASLTAKPFRLGMRCKQDPTGNDFWLWESSGARVAWYNWFLAGELTGRADRSCAAMVNGSWIAVDCDSRNGTDTVVCEKKDCYVGKSENYRGKLSVTQKGYTCQRWDSQLPHPHPKYRTPDAFIDADMPENYCRTPLGEDHQPWCYTTTLTKIWDYCDVKQCDGIDFAASRADGKLRPPAMLISASLGLWQLIHYM